jgi:polygalacturonase
MENISLHKTNFIYSFFLFAFTFLVTSTSLAQATSPKWEKELKDSLLVMAANLEITLKPWKVPNRIFLVEDYGAESNTGKVVTEGLQRAINACSAEGGGYVLLSKGDYISGTIDMKNWVMLKVEKNSRLLGSLNLSDYPDRIAKNETVMDTWMDIRHSLIYAENCERIGFCGEGTIDGQGEIKNFPGQETIAKLPGRPFLLRIIDCKKVVTQDLLFRNSASWMQDYLNCEDVIIQNLTVYNQGNHNNDGIDIDGCRNVIIRNCNLNVEDDGICFKGAGMRDSYNVLVENCTTFSECNALKFGTDSHGGIKNVLVRNCIFGGTGPEQHSFRRRNSSSTGVSWISADGGKVENLYMYNCNLIRTRTPFYLRLSDRGRTKPSMTKPTAGVLRRLIFEDITGQDNGKRSSIVQGIQGFPVTDIIFKNIDLNIEGGAKSSEIRTNPIGFREKYPDANSYPNILPAYGIWLEYAENIYIQNFKLKLKKSDERKLIFTSGGVIKLFVVD